jgi:hypothetical protein
LSVSSMRRQQRVFVQDEGAPCRGRTRVCATSYRWCDGGVGGAASRSSHTARPCTPQPWAIRSEQPRGRQAHWARANGAALADGSGSSLQAGVLDSRTQDDFRDVDP